MSVEIITLLKNYKTLFANVENNKIQTRTAALSNMVEKYAHVQAVDNATAKRMANEVSAIFEKNMLACLNHGMPTDAVSNAHLSGYGKSKHKESHTLR